MKDFGPVALFDTATSQEILDRNHSKAQNFDEEWEGGMMQIGLWKKDCENALSERGPAAYQRFGLLSACTQRSMKRALRLAKRQKK